MRIARLIATSPGNHKPSCSSKFTQFCVDGRRTIALAFCQPQTVETFAMNSPNVGVFFWR
jgi:hypothetical protein